MKIHCPYHDDSIPSMELYPKSAYCFGCGIRVDYPTLAKKLGVSLRELWDRSLRTKGVGQRKGYWMPWPPKRTDWNVPPSDFGPGYLIRRGFDPQVLCDLGIEYHSGWILFPLVTRPQRRMRGPVSQMRMACDDGDYVSIGSAGPYGRVVIEPENPKGTIYVEGPLDAIWIWQHSEKARAYRIGALCAPIRVSKDDSTIILWSDNDEGGERYINLFPKGVRIVRSDYEDPAATPPEVVRNLLEEVLA
jgi:hypothetical protein